MPVGVITASGLLPAGTPSLTSCAVVLQTVGDLLEPGQRQANGLYRPTFPCANMPSNRTTGEKGVAPKAIATVGAGCMQLRDPGLTTGRLEAIQDGIQSNLFLRHLVPPNLPTRRRTCRGTPGSTFRLETITASGLLPAGTLTSSGDVQRSGVLTSSAVSNGVGVP